MRLISYELETCVHIVLTYCEVEWDPTNVTTERKMPYRDDAFVAEMSRKCSKGGMVDVFHESDIILGSVTKSIVVDTALVRLVSAINVKETAPSRISNGNAKAKMVHQKGTFNEVVANSSHSVVTPKYLS